MFSALGYAVAPSIGIEYGFRLERGLAYQSTALQMNINFSAEIAFWLTTGIFVGAIVALIVFAILGRAAIRFLPLFRPLFAPLRWLSRLLRRRATQGSSEAATVSLRGLGAATDVELALQDIDIASNSSIDDSTTERDVDNTDPVRHYDFSEERRILKKHGILFKSYEPISSSYLPLHLVGPLTKEVSSFYASEAKKFFSSAVSLHANHMSLYDDAEGAFVVSLLRSADRRCYYFLNEVKKTINDNARYLVVSYSILIVIWVLVAAVAVYDSQLLWSTNPLTKVGLTVGHDTWVAIYLGATSCLLWGIMQQAHMAGYQKHQQHNFRELRHFLARYISRIADRYREATGDAKQVTVGDETDSKILAENAKKWHKILMWMPFRTFFIECFVRNIYYQIHRNTGYYLIIPKLFYPLLLTVVLFILHAGFGGAAVLTYVTSHDVLSFAIGVMFLISTVIYFRLIFKKVIAVELSHIDILGYDHLNVSTVMDEVVGKYAEDVGFWKGRLDR